MKKLIFILGLMFTFNSYAQKSTDHYAKVFDYNVYHKDWALVKTIAKTYGFIDRNGTEIVPSIYAKIYKFGVYTEKLAMVKSVADSYGFINEQGIEVIKAIYYTKEEAIQQLKKTL